MSYDERLNTYLQTLSRGLPLFLEDLEASALSERVPLIRKDTQDVIRMLLALHKPETILEIGTAVGFSGIFMCSCSDARIVTIENFPRRIREAEENIRKSGYGDRITLLPGDAQAILPTLEGPFDLALLDAAQGQYGSFLPELLRLLRSGGLCGAGPVRQFPAGASAAFAQRRTAHHGQCADRRGSHRITLRGGAKKTDDL